MTPRAHFALAALFAFVLYSSSTPATAQEKLDGKKAVAAATENLKKLKLDKPTILETDNFVIAGSIPADKAKALGAVLEKTLTVARKAAKFDDKETAWKGKLVVYYFPDGDEYKNFMRRVLVVTADGVHVDTRSEPPLIVDPAELPGKPTDADLYANTAACVAGELLKAKGTGTQMIPPWLKEGFGRVCAMRAEGTNSKRYTTYKTLAKNTIINVKGKPPAIGDVGSGEKSAAAEAMSNSLAEFLAFGPKSADFGKFLDAMRPSDANQNPTATAGYQAMGWKDDMSADASWKQWVRTGK